MEENTLMRLGADFVKDNEMKAVHDDDLVQLLNSLGVYENIIHGDYTCLFCKKNYHIR